MILVLEDDSEDAFLIGEALVSLGPYLPIVCRNVSEARAYLKGSGMYAERSQHPFPDGVICDMMLGPDSGLDFLEWSKSTKPFTTLPIMMLTGQASAHELLAARKQGAIKVMRKPGAFRELKDGLAEFLKALP